MQVIILVALLCLPYGVSVCLGTPSTQLARVGLGLMVAFAAVGHFVKTSSMAEMIPPFIPFRREITVVSGFIEIGLALAVILLPWHSVVGGVLIAFFIAIFPLNVYAAFRRIPFGGSEIGPRYLLIRFPLQALFIGWTLYFCILHP